MKAWNITSLERAFIEQDLPACSSDLERQCARAVHGIDVRDAATRLSAERKLTPGEVAVAESYGWRA